MELHNRVIRNLFLHVQYLIVTRLAELCGVVLQQKLSQVQLFCPDDQAAFYLAEVWVCQHSGHIEMNEAVVFLMQH